LRSSVAIVQVTAMIILLLLLMRCMQQ